MKRILLTPIIAIFLSLAGSLFFASPVLAAPKLSLEPGSATVVKDTTVTFTIAIDTENTSAVGSKAILNYPKGDVSVTSVVNGGFFPDFAHANDTQNGHLEINGYYAAQFGSKSGQGAFAIITLKALKDTGSGALTFSCSGSGTDTKILNTNGQNILSCSSLNQAGLTYSGNQPTATPTPTPTPTPGPGGTTPTPTPTPGGSNTNPTCTDLTVNPNAGSSRPLLVTLTCSGSDPDGYIAAAEFQFGDGKSRVVEKNVGGSGSIATTYNYNHLGTVRATCRVRDNSRVFSATPTGCTKTVEITTSAGATPTPTPTIIPTVTPQPVDLTPIATPAEKPAATPAKSSPMRPILPLILLGILAVGVGVYIIATKRKRSGPPHEPPSPQG